MSLALLLRAPSILTEHHTETGGLFRVAVKLMMACSTTNIDVCVPALCRERPHLMVIRRDYVPLVNIFGIYFQIRDDYMNLQSTQVGPVSPL